MAVRALDGAIGQGLRQVEGVYGLPHWERLDLPLCWAAFQARFGLAFGFTVSHFSRRQIAQGAVVLASEAYGVPCAFEERKQSV